MHSFAQASCPLAVLAIATLLGLSSASGHHHHERSSAKPAAEIIPLEPQFFDQYGSQRVKIRYPAQEIPPYNKQDGMKEWSVKQAPKPCSDCLITYMKPDLEYVDGTIANVDTGMWLHHSVSSCTNKPSLACNEPHGDLFFSCGNERAAFDIGQNGTQKVGYFLGKKDNIATLTELMNMADVPQTAVMTMTYEFIPNVPLDFEQAKPLWVDIAGCVREHELPLKQTSGAMTYVGDIWKSTKNYRIAMNIGHLHDGGIQQLTMRNGKTICESSARYGESPEYINSDKVAMDMKSKVHLSSMETCPDQGYVAVGDELSAKSFYDLTQHAPMRTTSGAYEPIMGISWLYLVEDDNLPLADKLRIQAAKAAEKAKEHSYSSITVLVLLFLGIAGAVFWIRRRRASAAIEEKDEETHRLGSLDRSYRDE